VRLFPYCHLVIGTFNMLFKTVKTWRQCTEIKVSRVLEGNVFSTLPLQDDILQFVHLSYSSIAIQCTYGGAENAGRENDGCENAGHENAGMKQQDTKEHTSGKRLRQNRLSIFLLGSLSLLRYKKCRRLK